MILTDEMLAVAFQYRDTELWEMLEDCDVFAFRLSDGEVGYCCVMGYAGQHLALALYRGDKGFSTYLKTIRFNEKRYSDFEMFEMAATFDCINCDFMQAADINAKVKKRIRNYADAHGLKVPRQKGWPDFVRHQPFKMSRGINSEKDANDMVEAFRAAMAVAEALNQQSPDELGFDPEGKYPTEEGGKPVPYLIPNAQGTYDWDTIKLPAFLPEEYPAPKFTNDILAKSVEKLPASGTIQMKLVHMPVPIGEGENVDAFLPAMLLCVTDELVFPVVSMESVEDNPEQIFVELVDNLRNNGSKPDTIEVMDDRTESFLANFCARCGIRLSRKDELSDLDDACKFLMSTFMQ